MDLDKDINSIRERGGSSDIGSKEDGAIEQAFNLGTRHLILKERAIYEFILADQIDPERTNIKLPNHTQRLVLDRGTESEIVSRSFLTAKGLFSSQYFGDTVDVEKALVISLDVVLELCVLDNEIEAYYRKENDLATWYNDRKDSPSYAIPSMIDVKTRCKTIFQKADHISQGLMEIIRLFYPEFLIQNYYSQFLPFIKEKYGAADTFTKFLEKIVPFIEIIRNARNCLDHRRTETIIKDYELQKDGNILSPTIEMEYRTSKISKMSLDQFLKITNKNMLYIFEQMIAHMSSKRVKPWAMLTYELREIPKNIRRNPHINYCFWSNLPGGYYHQ